MKNSKYRLNGVSDISGKIKINAILKKINTFFKIAEKSCKNSRYNFFFSNR